MRCGGPNALRTENLPLLSLCTLNYPPPSDLPFILLLLFITSPLSLLFSCSIIGRRNVSHTLCESVSFMVCVMAVVQTSEALFSSTRALPCSTSMFASKKKCLLRISDLIFHSTSPCLPPRHDCNGGSNWSAAIRAAAACLRPSVRRLNGAEFTR